MIQTQYGQNMIHDIIKIINSKAFFYSCLLFLFTFDATVIYPTRLSIADSICLIYIISNFNLTLQTLKANLIAIFFFFIFAIVNVLLITIYSESYNIEASYVSTLSGLVRPFIFTFFAIHIYSIFNKNKINNHTLYYSFLLFIGISFILITLQYIGYFPSLYNNNPSFGEIGRWTVFSEGFRPTGLTNESSFFANFLVLVTSASIHFNKKFGTKNELKFILFFSLITAILSTSRVAILYILIILIFSDFNFKSILSLTIISTIGILLGNDLSERMTNLVSIDGDASTFERYGNTLGFISTIMSLEWPWGTGYMNSSNLVVKYLPYDFYSSNLVSIVSFSLPLQLLVELGIISFFPLFYLYKLINKHKGNVSIYSAPLVCITTGMQNFLFFYIYIAIIIYMSRRDE